MDRIERGLYRKVLPGRRAVYVFRREVTFFDKRAGTKVTKNERHVLGANLDRAAAEAAKWHAYCDALEQGEQPRQRVTLGGFHSEYLQQIAGTLTAAAVTTIRCNTAPLVKMLGPDVPLDQVRRPDVERFLAERRKTVRPATMAGTFRDLRRMFNVALDHRFVDVSPLAGLRGERAPRAEPRLPAAEDVRRLVDYLKVECDWLHPVVVVLLYTGARLGEVLGLDWRHVDYARGQLTLVRPKVRDTLTLPMARPVSEATNPKWLQAGMPREGLVFCARGTDRRMSRYSVHGAFKRAARALGMDWLTLKALRNLAATRAVEATGNPRAAMELLGHKDMRTTAGYWSDRGRVRAEAVAGLERAIATPEPSSKPSLENEAEREPKK